MGPGEGRLHDLALSLAAVDDCQAFLCESSFRVLGASYKGSSA